MLYIFDIDGTIADCTHRLHFIKKAPKDWREFFAACVNDTPIWDVIDLFHSLRRSSNQIVMATGRSDEVRLETERWLSKYLKHDGLYMRKQGDFRQDTEVKADLLAEIDAAWVHPDIGGIFEDRKQCVDMYRAKGYRVFQVAEGDF